MQTRIEKEKGRGWALASDGDCEKKNLAGYDR
jgi:hypothetical protein